MRPTEIGAGDETTVGVDYADLGRRSWQPIAYQQKSSSRLLKGLRPAIDQREDAPKLDNPPSPRLALCDDKHLRRRLPGRIAQRIDYLDRSVEWQAATEVERSTCRRGDRSPLDNGHFVLRKVFYTHDNAFRRPYMVRPDQLGRTIAIDPLRSMPRGGGQS